MRNHWKLYVFDNATQVLSSKSSNFRLVFASKLWKINYEHVRMHLLSQKIINLCELLRTVWAWFSCSVLFLWNFKLSPTFSQWTIEYLTLTWLETIIYLFIWCAWWYKISVIGFGVFSPFFYHFTTILLFIQGEWFIKWSGMTKFTLN